jgi:transcriptional regulator with XRE-family HTH domain
MRSRTLADVEHFSQGEYRANTVAQYERGQRPIAVSRLAGLAELYDVSVAELLPPENPPAASAPPHPRLRGTPEFDLARLSSIAGEWDFLHGLIAAILRERGAAAGSLPMRLRRDDLTTLSAYYRAPIKELLAEWTARGLLAPAEKPRPRRAIPNADLPVLDHAPRPDLQSDAPERDQAPAPAESATPDPALYSATLGERLRAARNKRGLSLADVEELSSGELHANALGAYERGDRQIAVSRLVRLAELYRISPLHLLPDEGGDAPVRGSPAPPYRRSAGIDIHLPRLMALPPAAAAISQRYINEIQRERLIDLGETIRIRAQDLETLAMLHSLTPDELVARWAQLGIVPPGAIGALADFRHLT